MKIIVVPKSSLNQEIPDIFIKPDSTLLSKNQPFTAPFFDDVVMALPSISVKIDKIGKHIPLEITQNYFSQIAFSIHFKTQNPSLPKSIAYGFDGSTFISPKINFSQIENTKVEVLKDSETIALYDFFKYKELIKHTVYKASLFFTLKIGDWVSLLLDEELNFKEGNIFEINTEDFKSRIKIFDGR